MSVTKTSTQESNLSGSSSQVASTTVAYPAGIAAGDLLLLTVATDTVIFNTPSGFSLCGAYAGNAGCTAYAWYKIADGSESGSLTISFYNITNRAHITLSRFTSTTGFEANPVKTYNATNASSSTSITVTSGSIDSTSEYGFAVVAADSTTTLTSITASGSGWTDGTEILDDDNGFYAFATKSEVSSSNCTFTFSGTVDYLCALAVVIQGAPASAGPSWRSYSNLNRSTGSTQYSISVPSGVQDGDFLLAVLTFIGGEVTSHPAGWNLLHYEVISTGRYALYWKIASGETGPYAWNFSASSTGGAQIHAFSGVDTNHPIGDRTGNAANNATLPTVAGTALVADELMVGVFVARTSTSGSISTSSGATEHSDVAHTTNRVVGVQSKHLTATGSTGTMSVTITNFNANDSAYMMCLRPSRPKAPKVEKAHTAASASSGSSLTVTYGYTVPSGNVLIACCAYRRTGGTMSTPAGWTLIGHSVDTDRTSVFWKVADGSETQHTFSFGTFSNSSAVMVLELSNCSGVLANTSINETVTLDYASSTGVTGVTTNECAISIGRGSDPVSTVLLRTFPIGTGFEPIKDATAVVEGLASQNIGLGASVSYRTGTQATAYHFWPQVIDEQAALQLRLGYRADVSSGLFFGSNF